MVTENVGKLLKKHFENHLISFIVSVSLLLNKTSELLFHILLYILQTLALQFLVFINSKNLYVWQDDRLTFLGWELYLLLFERANRVYVVHNY